MSGTSRIRLIAIVTSVAVSAGCASRGANVVGMGLGLAMTGGGAAMYASADSPSDPDAFDGMTTFGAGFIVLGLAVMAGAGIGLMRSEPEPVRVEQRAPVDRRELDRLAQHALDRARADDCVVARMTVELLRERDHDYAVLLVAREPPIRACMP